MEIGLNLYSLRNLIKTEDGFFDTMIKLKDIGISYVQYSGAEFDAERIARVSERSGVPVVLTHAPIDRILGDTENLMKEHSLFGCKNIGLGSMPQKAVKDASEFYETVERIEEAAKKISDGGCKFFYHNHHFEFYKRGGETALDYIIRKAPHVNFTLDTYWVRYGGGEIYDIIERLSGRIECVHLKDYEIYLTNEGKFEPRFAPLGDGNMNFKKIIDAMKRTGTKYFLIEQDNAVEFPDPLGQIERSVKYIKENF